MTDPIHYGDVVGLVHPGTYARITKEKGDKEFLQFTVEGIILNQVLLYIDKIN